jgi:hypothetical protein
MAWSLQPSVSIFPQRELERRLALPHVRRTSTNTERGAQAGLARRAACLAHREKRREGASDHEAHEAAVAAVQALLPLPWKEASAEAVSAVAYTTKYHSEWFWRTSANQVRSGNQSQDS